MPPQQDVNASNTIRFGPNGALALSDNKAIGWTGDTLMITNNNITYTFPSATRRFARLKVVGP